MNKIDHSDYESGCFLMILAVVVVFPILGKFFPYNLPYIIIWTFAILMNKCTYGYSIILAPLICWLGLCGDIGFHINSNPARLLTFQIIWIVAIGQVDKFINKVYESITNENIDLIRQKAFQITFLFVLIAYLASTLVIPTTKSWRVSRCYDHINWCDGEPTIIYYEVKCNAIFFCKARKETPIDEYNIDPY